MTDQVGNEQHQEDPAHEGTKPGIEVTTDQEPNTFEPEEDPEATEPADG